jgi:hypothetical protein
MSVRRVIGTFVGIGVFAAAGATLVSAALAAAAIPIGMIRLGRPAAAGGGPGSR